MQPFQNKGSKNLLLSKTECDLKSPKRPQIALLVQRRAMSSTGFCPVSCILDKNRGCQNFSVLTLVFQFDILGNDDEKKEVWKTEGDFKGI